MIRTLREQRLRNAVDKLYTLLSGDIKRIPSRQLVHVFGSVSDALEAPENELCDMVSFPDALALQCVLTPELARYMICEEAGASQALTLDDILLHLRGLYLGMHYECGYIFCFNAQGDIVRIAQLRMGSVDEAPFYTRIVLEEALFSGGEKFVLAHNHPGGSRFASADDLQTTLKILTAMHEMGLTLIDHVIYADNEIISIREASETNSDLWSAFSPLEKPFEHWLSR